MVFVRVVINNHSQTEAKKLEQEVKTLDQVIACYSMDGDTDFLLQFVAPDWDTYTDFAMSVIQRLPSIKEMQSMFVLKEIKAPTSNPLDHIDNWKTNTTER